MQELPAEDHRFCKAYHINILNELNAWEFKAVPKHIKYAKSSKDFQIKYGNRMRWNMLKTKKLDDPVHVADEADHLSMQLIMNYICRGTALNYPQEKDGKICC